MKKKDSPITLFSKNEKKDSLLTTPFSENEKERLANDTVFQKMKSRP
jgi:hypothetical protein